jgi:transglutaminase-like putative cysteine protease
MLQKHGYNQENGMRRIAVLCVGLMYVSVLLAQNAVVEEAVTEVVCSSPTMAVQHFKTVTTIQNEHGASQALFLWSCSKNDKLTGFKGQVVDAAGRVIRKIKESNLSRTEYSPYLAIDDYKVYFDYTPPSYPVTVTYEWTVESRDNLIEFPSFCPQTDYDISVKKATYCLKAPKSMRVRYAIQNIDAQVHVADVENDKQTFTLQVENLPALKKEAFSRPMNERLPLAWFAPTDFVYYGTKGSLDCWADYGKWEYGLIQGRDQLTEAERQELHQLTDGLKTDREKVEAIYHRLEKNTRYVAVLLGIGGQQPAPASHVSKSGFGDCKGLSNYMRAMLNEVGIASHYTTVSTTNRRLLSRFASVGQMNHVILQVPLSGDTLWLECTNPQLPMGYVHARIAGHDAIEISEHGGRLVRLPAYADSANVMHSTISIQLSNQGAADVKFEQQTTNSQYESTIPLLKMDGKERQSALLQMVHIPQAEVRQLELTEAGASIRLEADIKSQRYATQTGQRLMVPVCPIHRGYAVPNSNTERQEDIYRNMGYMDVDDITIHVPDGYEVEAKPKDMHVESVFGTFSFTLQEESQNVHVSIRLLMKSGTFPKALFPELASFIRTISASYNQKVVLKRL